MLDSKGVIRKDRENLSESKAQFATARDLESLDDAIDGADVFIGLSTGDIFTPEMLNKMAARPIVFALANPDPEIAYDLAMATRKDIIMATGRSDHPNQVNNVLGFPYIFRGALDVRATEINEEMKLAAVKAIAELAKEQVPDAVSKAYGAKKIVFGEEYLIPKPLDPRLITTISPAVAKAAMETGVAKSEITDWPAYELELQRRIGIDQKLMTFMINRAKKDPKVVVFAEADNYKTLKAAQIVKEEGIAHPILLGDTARIKSLIEEFELDVIVDCPVIDPSEQEEKRDQFGDLLFEKRKRKGMTIYEARRLMRDRNYFGAMMVEVGEADALISGLTKDYASTITPALQIIGMEDHIQRVAGMYIMINKKGTFFFADTTLNTNPTSDELVDIVSLTARAVRFFDHTPRVAMLSYSNFGSGKGPVPTKVSEATEKVKQLYPDLIIDGEMQANIALSPELQQEIYPFSELAKEGANTLIFPDLASGNIAYKLLQEMGNMEAIGPVLMGMRKPVHVLQLGSSVREIVNMVSIAVVDAQTFSQRNNE